MIKVDQQMYIRMSCDVKDCKTATGKDFEVGVDTHPNIEEWLNGLVSHKWLIGTLYNKPEHAQYIHIPSYGIITLDVALCPAHNPLQPRILSDYFMRTE